MRYDMRTIAQFSCNTAISNGICCMSIPVGRPADGLSRRTFTVGDVCRMMEAGIFSEDERFELIEGDIVMMSHKVAHIASKTH
jgi:hypothetical protein